MSHLDAAPPRGPGVGQPGGGGPGRPRPEVSYRFALRPKWLLIHLLALLALAVMVAACFWQLARLEQKQDRNRLLDSRTAQPVAPLDALLRPTDGAEAAEPLTYRIVQATGTYAADQEVFVRNRSFNGAPGAWVLTPLVTGTGEAVVVNRGWIPASNTTPQLPPGAEAPSGEVTVTGLLLPSQRRGIIGPRDPGEGRLAVLARADLERLQQQVDLDLYPAYLQLLPTEATGHGDLPQPLPEPERTEGPHRGYAGQWALFALIWVIGYPILLRRSARRRAFGPDDPDDPDGPAGPGPLPREPGTASGADAASTAGEGAGPLRTRR